MGIQAHKVKMVIKVKNEKGETTNVSTDLEQIVYNIYNRLERVENTLRIMFDAAKKYEEEQKKKKSKIEPNKKVLEEMKAKAKEVKKSG